jgi:hypothetical protein
MNSFVLSIAFVLALPTLADAAQSHAEDHPAATAATPTPWSGAPPQPGAMKQGRGSNPMHDGTSRSATSGATAAIHPPHRLTLHNTP